MRNSERLIKKECQCYGERALKKFIKLAFPGTHIVAEVRRKKENRIISTINYENNYFTVTFNTKNFLKININDYRVCFKKNTLLLNEVELSYRIIK
jgi:hypothetical protein